MLGYHIFLCALTRKIGYGAEGRRVVLLDATGDGFK